ncbi:MAG: PEP-CTERM sorting domain-containing protein [Verrucomicrobia bacterium]|nr:PEP-CTERM sorting domain-containing protein [Verrucomicrobiota bacterium]MCH8510165.1 PEP-CTERM sorting domain-containing protein [Kiritimatiellia bacterium]
MQIKLKSAVFALTVSGLALTTRAGFILLDNFESYNVNRGVTDTNPGDLGATWSNAGFNASEMEVINDNGNQVLRITNTDSGNSSFAFRALPTEIAGSSTEATYFWRMRFVDTPLQAWTGLTQTESNPNDFGDWDTYAGINTSQSPNNINVRDGGSNVTPGNIAANTWGYFWMVVDNSQDEFELFYNITGDTAVSGDSLGTFSFRNVTGGDPLVNFGIIRGGLDGGEIQFDDIYIDTTGANLVNPIPEPSTLVLLGLAGLSAISVLRKKQS